MTNAITVLIQYSLIYCLIVGLILTLRHRMYKITGARWVYAIWLVLFVPLGIIVIPDTIVASMIPSALQDWSLPGQLTSVASLSSFNAFAIAVVVIWLGGVMVTVWRSAQTRMRLSLALMSRCQQLTTHQAREIDHFCRRAGVFPAPEVRFSPDIDGPALLGIVNPQLLLPQRFFDRFTSSEQALMIFHELVHFRRKDACWNLLFCALRCVFWFNPLVRLAERRFRLDQEQSCDRFVLWDEPSAQRVLYASAMLKVAEPASSGKLIGFRNTTPEIFNRVAMLRHHRKSLSQSIMGPFSLALLLLAVFIVAAPATKAVYSNGVTYGWCAVYQGLGF